MAMIAEDIMLYFINECKCNVFVPLVINVNVANILLHF